ncbi:MAG: hypothetical protein U5L01_01610 [Rheinheimera sp.]|nr:hypothetical protein [Rheinheimera sp.]
MKNYSAELIELLKERMEFKKDADVVAMLPNTTKGNLSQIKSGQRHLTQEQAIWIAEVCALDCALVLVELAAESTKSQKAQSVWHALAKKMKATASILAVAAFFTFSGLSGHYLPQRLRNSP